jgi:hypothetical protein
VSGCWNGLLSCIATVYLHFWVGYINWLWALADLFGGRHTPYISPAASMMIYSLA